jgi:hypothetical protein
LARDPWDAQLVPIEPDPEDFDTFEEFEAAMRRWGNLVSQIEVIPMHATQLPHVIPLASPTQQQQVKTSDQIVGKLPSAPRRAGLPYLDFWDPLKNSDFHTKSVGLEIERPVFLPDLELEEDLDDLEVDTPGLSMPGSGPLSARSPPLSPTGLPPYLLGSSDLLLDSSNSERLALRASKGSASTTSADTTPRFFIPLLSKEAVISDVSDGLNTIYSRAMQNYEKHPPYHNPPVLGRVHGTFPKPEWAGHKSPSRLVLRSDMLRRTDLTPLQVVSSHDCLAMIDGRPVEFNLPEFDLKNVNYRELCSDSQYKAEIRRQVLQLQFHDRHYPCYSWFRKTPKAQVQQESSKLKNLVRTGGRNLTIEQISDVLLGPLDLDIFQDILGEDLEMTNGETTTYGSIMAQSVKVSQFHKLLDLFDVTQEALAHSKIASFISVVLQFSKAHELVQHLVGNGTSPSDSLTAQSQQQFAHLAVSTSDLLSPRVLMGTLRNKGPISGPKYLCLLCYALSYFRPIRTDIFPFSTEVLSLGTNVIGTEYKNLMELIFIYYYVKIIQQILSSQSLEYGTAAQKVNKTLNVVSTSLLTQLNAYPAFLGSLISSIGFRSVTVSSLFTFLTLQLLHCEQIGGDSSFSTPRVGSNPNFHAASSMGETSSTSAYANSIQIALENASAIKALIADPAVNLIGSILKTLASSKFTHVRHACQRIVSVLASPQWLDTSLALIEATAPFSSGPFYDLTHPDATTSPHYLEALSVIIKEGLTRATDSADYLVSNPSGANFMVPAPVRAVKFSTAPLSLSLSSTANTSSAPSTSSSGSNIGALRLPLGSVSSGSAPPSPASPGSATPATASTSSRIPYADLVELHARAIGFILSNRVLYSLLSVCGKTITAVDYRTSHAANLLSHIGRAFTKLRTFKLAPDMKDIVSPELAKRISIMSVQPSASAMDMVSLLSQMRDYTTVPQNDRAIYIGTHELRGVFQFLYSACGTEPRLVHESKTGLLVCLRHLLKSSVIFEAAKSESEMHQTLASLCRSPPYRTNTEAWRCLYQMVKFHPTTIEYLVKSKYLNLYFEGLGSYGTSDKWTGLIMTQNALKYMTKLFSLNSADATSTGSKRPERTSSVGTASGLMNIGSATGASSGSGGGSPTISAASSSSSLGSPAGSSPPHGSPIRSLASSSSSQTPDAKALSQFIINTHVFIKFHVIFKKLTEMDCGAAYAEMISFYHALLTLPNCKKLRKATMKHDSFKEGIAVVSQISPILTEMQKQDRLWSAARAVVTKDRIRAFKVRERDEAALGSPRKTKDKSKDVKDKKKKEKDKEKEKPKRGKSLGALPNSSPRVQTITSGIPISPPTNTAAASSSSTMPGSLLSSSPHLTSDASSDTDHRTTNSSKES